MNIQRGGKNVHKTRFGLELVEGNIDGMRVIHKFGTNPTVGTTSEDVWMPGGALTWLTVAATIEAISDDANDTAAGTGAQILTIEGLDASFNEISETITMNGLAATTATSNSYIRVNQVYVTQVGTYHGTNLGTITIRVSGAGATQAEIGLENGLGTGQTFKTHYTVPAGFTGYLGHFAIYTDTSKILNIQLRQYENADDIAAPFTGASRTQLNLNNVAGGYNFVDDVPLTFPEKTDIWFQGYTGTGTSSVNIDYEIILVANA
jgi:hypothetical protein